MRSTTEQGERNGQTSLSISEPRGGYLNRSFKYNRITGFTIFARTCLCSSVWIECFPPKEEVMRSNRITGIKEGPRKGPFFVYNRI